MSELSEFKTMREAQQHEEIAQLREQIAKLQATIEQKNRALQNIANFTSIDLMREAAKFALSESEAQ